MQVLRRSVWIVAISLLIRSTLAPTFAQPEVPGGRDQKTITWVKGTVRDEAGRPIAGITVYARATYYGGIRMNGLLHTVVTDAEGHYAIEGRGGLSSFSATIVAHVPGHPPALSWFSLPDPRRFDALGFEVEEERKPQDDIDLVILDRSGKLEVLVTKDGTAVAGASVALRLEGADPFDHWGLEGQSDERTALYAICRPVAQSGMDGIARFEALPPGVYSVFASEGDRKSAFGLTEYHRWFPFGDPPTYGESRSVAVHSGETMTHRIALFQHGCVARFEIRRDGNDWMQQQRLQMDGTLPDGESGARATAIGEDGTDTYRFETARLAHVSFTKYSTSAHHPRQFPFMSADGWVGASPRLSNSGPVILAAHENRGGVIFVRIEDEGGRGLAGLARFHGSRSGFGSDSGFRDVAESGSLISGFEPAPGRVEAIASGRPRILPSENMGSMPRDEDLVGRSEILPQAVVARNNEQVEVALRYEKVGYVRGRLVPPTDRTPQQYRVGLGRSHYRAGAGVVYKPDTGEFLAGPFRSGKAALTVSAGFGFIPFMQHEVDVRAGEVAELKLEIAADAEQATRPMRSVSGRIWLADGTTPAGLVAVAKWTPGDQHPWRIGMTDTGGLIRQRAYWYLADGDEAEPEPQSTPREPVYLAWQPGRCGATILPMPTGNNHSLAITLPPPISLRGNVMVVGDGDTVDNGTIAVRAQYEGRGTLDDLLSVETTAGADGRFELAGLTPGKYRVQAALDGIWLSPSVEFVAGEKALEPVTLTIAPPGGPVLVKLIGQRQRQPEKLTVNRPKGPLHDRLWPKFLTPDGAGVVRIPALEAGRHVVRVGNVEKEVAVLPLTESKGRPEEIELKLGE